MGIHLPTRASHDSPHPPSTHAAPSRKVGPHVCRSHPHLCQSRRRRATGACRSGANPSCPRAGRMAATAGAGVRSSCAPIRITDNLTPFFYEPIVKAKNGDRGGRRQCSGKAARTKSCRCRWGRSFIGCRTRKGGRRSVGGAWRRTRCLSISRSRRRMRRRPTRKRRRRSIPRSSR